MHETTTENYRDEQTDRHTNKQTDWTERLKSSNCWDIEYYCPSVCPSVCNVGGSGAHGL